MPPTNCPSCAPSPPPTSTILSFWLTTESFRQLSAHETTQKRHTAHDTAIVHPSPERTMITSDTEAFWPDGARLAVTVYAVRSQRISRSAALEDRSPSRFSPDFPICCRTRSTNIPHQKVCPASC